MSLPVPMKAGGSNILKDDLKFEPGSKREGFFTRLRRFFTSHDSGNVRSTAPQSQKPGKQKPGKKDTKQRGQSEAQPKMLMVRIPSYASTLESSWVYDRSPSGKMFKYKIPDGAIPGDETLVRVVWSDAQGNMDDGQDEDDDDRVKGDSLDAEIGARVKGFILTDDPETEEIAEGFADDGTFLGGDDEEDDVDGARKHMKKVKGKHKNPENNDRGNAGQRPSSAHYSSLPLRPLQGVRPSTAQPRRASMSGPVAGGWVGLVAGRRSSVNDMLDKMLDKEAESKLQKKQLRAVLKRPDLIEAKDDTKRLFCQTCRRELTRCTCMSDDVQSVLALASKGPKTRQMRK